MRFVRCWSRLPRDTVRLTKGKFLKEITVISLRSEPCDKMKEMSSVLLQHFYFTDAMGFSDVPTN